MFYDLIESRRSIRDFNDSPIEWEKIELLKKAALLAPTSKNKQSVDFVFVENKATLNTLSEAKNKGGSFIKNAALGIVVVANSQIDDVWVEDAAVASTYLVLMAENLDLASCWSQIRRRFNDNEGNLLATDVVKKILKIPQSYEVLSIIAMGYKSDVYKAPKERDINQQRIHNEEF